MDRLRILREHAFAHQLAPGAEEEELLDRPAHQPATIPPTGTTASGH